MGKADVLKTEGLVLESIYMGHMGVSSQVELSVISICMIWMKGIEAMHIVGPRLKGSGARCGRISNG
jgi:hypothetical protein